ncbi:MAG TPA: hypothetical protein VLK58_07580 [Conexibacter sp.]|nr:hypothetical protein [Conexibacter sp.]
MPESREDVPRRLDLAGITLFGTACLAVVFGLIRGNDDGWSSAPIVASIVLLGAFVLVALRRHAPMLPLGLFLVPAFTGTRPGRVRAVGGDLQARRRPWRCPR